MRSLMARLAAAGAPPWEAPAVAVGRARKVGGALLGGLALSCAGGPSRGIATVRVISSPAAVQWRTRNALLLSVGLLDSSRCLHCSALRAKAGTTAGDGQAKAKPAAPSQREAKSGKKPAKAKEPPEAKKGKKKTEATGSKKAAKAEAEEPVTEVSQKSPAKANRTKAALEPVKELEGDAETAKPKAKPSKKDKQDSKAETAVKAVSPKKASAKKPAAAAGEQQQPIKSDKTVVVVESPTKAKTIEKYLGDNFVVVASYGHVRDLAARSGSVRPQDDFDLVWEVPEDAKARLDQIKAALVDAKVVLLASDPDREGEAIAWHVHELLKREGALKGMQVQRVTFNEITKTAVQAGVRSPRGISHQLVEAYLARRALDYLIGFDISPLLWRKLPGSKSAGRVQSAALCLLAEREREIDSFSPKEFWTVDAQLSAAAKSKSRFPARLTFFKGTKLEQFSLTAVDAKAAEEFIRKCTLCVQNVKSTTVRRNPPGPYITSSLQQDASNKLGLGAARTMSLAQKLYEGVKLADGEQVGLITYMRTDSHQLSSQATESIRLFALEKYGQEYVPKAARKYKAKVKNAQEAHEAIRPTDIRLLPSALAGQLEPEALSLYALIWRRTMACQLEQAVMNQLSLDVGDPKGVVKLRSTASSVGFPGYQVVFKDRDALAGDEEAEEEKQSEEKLPSMEVGTAVSLLGVEHKQHFTEPPPRYTEGSLVRKLEELGIGRPSTYAGIIKTLQARQYIRSEKQRLFTEIRGRMVATFLSHFFTEYVDYGFTAKMEEQLDSVSSGQIKWKEVLRQFWPDFHDKVTSTSQIPNQKVAEVLAEIFSAKLAGRSRSCPSCKTGELQLKFTKFGSGYFLGCNSYPACRYVNSLEEDEENDEWDETTPPKPMPSVRLLGVDPKSGLSVFCKGGPFGSYIQVGEDGRGKLKPKRVPIPSKLKPEEFDLESALKLTQYPITLGTTSEGKTVTVGLGKSGCYVRVGGYSVFVPTGVKVEELTLETALTILERGKMARRQTRKQPASRNAAAAAK